MAKSYITTGRVAENRKARHEYEIEDRVEAGLVLMGSEVKSLRTGRASIAESYAGEDNGRLMLFNANLPSYEAARLIMNRDALANCLLRFESVTDYWG